MPRKRAFVVAELLPALVLAACAWLHGGPAWADTKVRTSSFHYNAIGLLEKEVVEPTRPDDCLETTYTYDSYGNRETATSRPCAGATGHTLASADARTTRNSHAPDGRFARTTTNALGQSETKDYDIRFGAVTRLTGPNGLATTWEYDGFGRKKKEVRADGTSTTWSYLPCTATGANCPATVGAAAVAWVLVEDHLGSNGVAMAPPRRQYHDVLGRVVRVQTLGFDGAGAAPVLVQDTEYDRRGRVARKSQVYALAGGNPQWSLYSYDTLDRVTAESAPDPDATGGMATTTIAYAGLTTTVTNSKAQRRTTLKNAQGQVARVTDHAGSTLVFSYDALGQLTQTNAAGSVTTLEYDQRGRKVGMVDPAMGAWQYRYNAFGELVWQRDSLGRVATLEYDPLGRMKRRVEADLVSEWRYDFCLRGIGKLCSATATNGYMRAHHYDTLGRLQHTHTLLDSLAAETFAYEPATGRLASKTWPTGYQLRYEYTALGFLRKASGSGSGYAGTATYEVLAMDAQDHVTQYRQGTQVKTVRTYDGATGRLKAASATREGSAEGSVLSHTYAYDSLGNLRARTDSSPGAGTSETYEYDTLNRLTRHHIVGGAVGTLRTTQVMYDGRGNILYKSDVGRYWYDAQRPNRMTNVTLETAPGATVANTGTRALSYGFDDTQPGAQAVNGVTLGNGNLLYTVSLDTANGRHTHRGETYTSFNMPSQFTYANFANGTAAPADRTLTFVYGPEHQRIKKQVQLSANAPTAYSAGTTWYLHGGDGLALSYEKEMKDNGLTEHRHFLEARGMVFAMVVGRTGYLPPAPPSPTQPPTATLPPSSILYFHHDHLGSVAAITDEAGTVVERLAYDPWGKRRNVNGTADPLDAIVGWNTDRGFTMHEHLDELGIVHMNGRVYDPLVGRFMSADPYAQPPHDLQSYNRYAYVSNNPLAFTDPSGYLKKWIKPVLAIAVAVFAPPLLATYGVAVAGMSAATATMINAAAAGAMAGAIATGNLKGALQGAVGAALFAGAGQVAGMAGASSEAVYAAHAAAGCVSAEVGGGSCGSGAAGAAFGKFTTNYIQSNDLLSSNAAKGVASAVAGGVGSVIAGGKFENGAVTAAFGYLFNHLGGKLATRLGTRAMLLRTSRPVIFAEEYLAAEASMSTGAVAAIGYRSHEAFKGAFGPAGAGRQWHHLVEQNADNLAKFGAERIHHPSNLVNISETLHHQITSMYNTSNPLTHQRLRDVVNNWSFEQQQSFALEQIQKLAPVSNTVDWLKSLFGK